jgi:hypothetical protein
MYQGAGTLLDGELVVDRTNGRWTFLIFDCVHLCSIPQFMKTYDERMRVVAKCLSMTYIESPDDSLRLDVKTFVPLEHAPLTAENFVDNRYACDGYVYMPRGLPVVFGHHQSFFKLKSHHTVDFMFHNKYLTVFNQSTKRHVRAGVLEDGHNFKDGDVLECELLKFDKQPAKRVWRVVSLRRDKNKANTLFVLEKTLLNMQQQLTYEDIRSLTH